MTDLLGTVAQLEASSARLFVNPHTLIEWPDALEPTAWCTSPELVTLHGTEHWDALDDDARTRLAFWEAVNFFSLNIDGERQQVEGIAHRLARPELAHLADYLHQFLDEENKHSIVFRAFCRRYAGTTYAHPKVVVEQPRAPGEDDLLFFARILVFEELAVAHNATMARDERVHPVVRAINRFHHQEEVRHLRFGRAVIRDLWGRWSPGWSADVRARVAADVTGFLAATWLEYANAAAYRDAGLPDPFRLRAAVVDHPVRRARQAALAAPCLHFFTTTGILEEDLHP